MHQFKKYVMGIIVASLILSPFSHMPAKAAYDYSSTVEKDTITGSAISISAPDDTETTTGSAISISAPDETVFIATNGDDNNNGSENAPFKSIQKGIDLAMDNQQSGLSTKVVIKEGVYQPDALIHMYDMDAKDQAFVHLVGEGNVVITGALEWKDWTKEGSTNIYSKDWDYRWGKVHNTYEGRIPEPLQYREIAFVDDVPMLPVRSYEELQPGTMFVSETEGKLFICPPNATGDLNAAKVEVSESGGFVNRDGNKMGNLVEIINASHLVIENIHFEKAAAGVSDAVAIQGAYEIVIKDSTFNNSAYGGLRFDKVTNGTIINCEANGNGGKGIAISNGKNIIVQDSETLDNNWFGYPYGWIQWDPAGMKIFRAHEIRLINHNASNNLCEGIWADTDIINMYIENPKILENKNHGLWIEANVGPVFVQGGRVEENKNYGLYNSSTENLIIDGVTFKNNKGEIAIGDFNTKGRGPLVDDPVWAGDYGNTFGNFETGEGFVSHAVDMTIKNSTFVGEDLSETPLFIYVKSDDKESYKPFMDTLTANNNHYSHYNPEKAFYIATGAKEGYFGNFDQWKAATSQDADSVFSNTGMDYTDQLPPSGKTSDEVSPKVGQRVVQASRTDDAPTIDGVLDDVWNTTTTIETDYTFENQDKDKGIVNATGIARLLWDDNYLYYNIIVDDPNPTRGTNSNWQCDNVEVFLDQNYNQTETYEADDGQYRIGHDGERSGKTLTWDLSALEEYAAKINDDHYVVEGKIKINHVNLIEGRVMGFDIQVADEREVAGVYGRRGIQMWNDKTANGYNSTANWGYLELVEEAVDVATIPEDVILEEVTTNIPLVLEAGNTHAISIEAFLSDGTKLTEAMLNQADFVYGSADKSIVDIDENGIMTAKSEGKTFVSVRITYNGSTKTVTKQIVVPGNLSAFNYEHISPQSDQIHDYSGTITFYPYGCEWMTSGTEIVFYNVDFGDNASNLPYLNYQIQGHAIGEKMAGGTIEFRIDDPSNPAFGSILIEDTSEKLDESVDDWNYANSRLMKTTMTQNITGKHTLYMRFVGEPGNEMHANLRMGKFYWGHFVRSNTPIMQEVTEKKMVDLFNLDFSDDTMGVYGTHNILADETKVAELKISASGSEGDLVEIRDGQLYFEKDNGPSDNDYGQMQLALNNIDVPETDVISIAFDMNVKNWTMEEKWQDFPKIVFEKEDGSKALGVLVMEKGNGIGGNFNASGGWKDIDFTDATNQNKDINFRYEFNMNTGTFKVYKDDVLWVDDGEIYPEGDGKGTAYVPKTLDSMIFKLQKAEGDEKQKIAFDNFKVSYLTEVQGEAQYMLSVLGGTGGGSYKAGDEVTVEANPNVSGKQFKEWKVTFGNLVLNSTDAKKITFLMPDEHINIEGIYEDILVTDISRSSIETLFDLDFTDSDINDAGTYAIGEGAKVGQLVLEAGEDHVISNGNNNDVLRLEGKGTVLKLNELLIPNTSKIKLTYDLTVLEGFDGTKDAYSDFPKIEFLTRNNEVKFGSLMLQKHNELLLISLKKDKTGTNYESFPIGTKIGTTIPVIYEFDMVNGSYQLSMGGHQFGYGNDDIWMSENDPGTEFLPQSLHSIYFKTGAGSDESNQIVEFDNFKVEYELTTWSLNVEAGSGSGYYPKGEALEITADKPAKGYEFSHWEVLYGSIPLNNITDETITILMPDKAVGLKAIYSEKTEDNKDGNNGGSNGSSNNTSKKDKDKIDESSDRNNLQIKVDVTKEKVSKAVVTPSLLRIMKENKLKGVTLDYGTFSATFALEDLVDKEGDITFSKEEIDSSTIDLPGIQTKNKNIKVFDFKLSTEKQGQVTNIHKFQKPVEVRFGEEYFEEIQDPRNLVFGHIGTDGTFEQMKLIKNDDGTYSAFISHFSQFVLYEKESIFKDMNEHWALEYAEILSARGLVESGEDILFDPAHQLTRAEFSHFLTEGLYLEAEGLKEMTFEDINSNSPYYNSVKTLYSLGIINGFNTQEFRPDATITREQAFKIMVNIYNHLETKEVEESDLTKFEDVDQISPWARKATAQGVNLGIIHGYSTNTIQPQNRITKAEGAKLIVTMLETLGVI